MAIDRGREHRIDTDMSVPFWLSPFRATVHVPSHLDYVPDRRN